MGLVDNQKRDLSGNTGQHLSTEAFIRQPLGGDQKNIDPARSKFGLDSGPIICVVGVDRGRTDSHALCRCDLVSHQRQ
jgi:hypothetical protein